VLTEGFIKRTEGAKATGTSATCSNRAREFTVAAPQPMACLMRQGKLTNPPKRPRPRSDDKRKDDDGGINIFFDKPRYYF
jgi:hypothetical protein